MKATKAKEKPMGAKQMNGLYIIIGTNRSTKSAISFQGSIAGAAGDEWSAEERAIELAKMNPSKVFSVIQAMDSFVNEK